MADDKLIPAPGTPGTVDGFDVLDGVGVAPLGASRRPAKVDGLELTQDPAKLKRDTERARMERRHFAWRDRFLAVLRTTRNISTAAASVGISRQSAYNFRRRYDDFRREWDDAIEYALDRIEESVMKVAMEGEVEPVLGKVTDADGRTMIAPVYWKRKFHPQLAINVLARLRPDKWGDEISTERAEDAATKIGRAIEAIQGVSFAEPEFEPDTTPPPEEEGAPDDAGKHEIQSPYGE